MRTLALIALAAACTTSASGSPPDSAADVLAAMDLPAPQDIARTDAGSDVTNDAAPDAVTDRPQPCAGPATACLSGTPGGACGDGALQARCVDGAWRCPGGTIPADQCACVGRPPGACTCASTGWVCDAGLPVDVAAPTDSATKVDCDPAHARCNRIPPECAGGGEVPSVRDGCWGACVVYTACAPIACDPDVPGACPSNLVCYRTTRRCGPYL
jgi:hypothetical protein